jgi:TolB-like protein/class 3 adenylate cyclase/Flp pilus assembly protein TadD
MTATRRLAAIFAADVAGYSRLMGADEEGTHERLKAHRRELLDPKIGEHSGRIVKNTGDGMLVEFPSVVDAVRCAAELQRAMIDREAGMPADRRIRFRIGINLGDVIAEDDDIFGDGVNIAARLEALAEPGGLCVSGTVRDHIGDRLPYAFEDLGEQSVKNIARPVRVYALRPELTADPPAPSVPAVPPISQPAVAPRMSIVVLPFANLGDDPEQQYFADGITEDLTTNLSRIADMVVISRSTAFTYKEKRVDAKQIGRELCVRYMLEGSVRRSGSRVRVNAQLIDAESDAHLWAERFDGSTEDLFALQDEIARGIANALGVELIAAEAARPTDNPDALDCVLRGRAVWLKPNSRDVYAEAIGWYERALALDPQSVEAKSLLANAFVGRAGDNMTDSPAADIARAEELVDQALAAQPRNAYAHFVKGKVLQQRNRLEEAILEFENSLALNRNSVWPLHYLALCKLATGSIEEVVPLEQQAIRLSPREPRIGWWYRTIGAVHLLQSRIDEAIVWLERARSDIPAASIVRSYLAAAYALNGETERASAELAESRRLSSDDRYSSIARLRAVSRWGPPKTRALFETTYCAGLRQAGMPDE